MDCQSIWTLRIVNPYTFNTQKKKNANSKTYCGDSRTKADTNDEHTLIDEDEPQIEEKKMREFERINEKYVNEWCRHTNSQSVFHI